jgi:tape measure domain-containing protein
MNEEIRYTVTLRDLFSQKMKDAAGEAENLNKKVDGAAKGLNNMRSAARNTESEMLRGVKRFGGNLIGALGVGFGAAQVVGFGKSVVDSLVNYEYFSASLRTLMRGDEQVAQALQTQLVSLAKETPFSLVEVQDATKQLLAYGFSAGDVTKNIRMLGDVASGLKIPFSDIAYLYGTLKTQGRAYTRDIMQFTQRGIPVIKELAKQFNVTEAEVSKMVESGKVGFSDIEKAFQFMTKNGGMFYNMMQEQSKTTGGQISMLGDSWEQLKVNIGKSQTGIIQGTISFLNELTSGLAQGFAYENYVSEAFAKENIKQFGFFDNFGFGGNTKKMMSEALAAQAMQRESLAAKGKGQSVLAKTQAENEYLSLKRSYKLGKIEKEEYDIRSAILMKNIQNLQGIYRTYGMKGTAPAPAGASTPTGATTAEAAARASAPKYTQIHINIAEMKAAENIEISDVKDPNYRVVADKVMEMITGALNDAQRMSVH